jgi:lysophospholipase L1-like esterase
MSHPRQPARRRRGAAWLSWPAVLARPRADDRSALRHGLALLAAALVVAACGGGSDERPATTAPPAPAQPPATQPPAPPTTPTQTTPAPDPTPNVIESRTGKRRLFVIGDSLTVGVAPLLEPVLPGWTVAVDALGGRPLAEGMKILDATSFPRDGSVVLGMGLFTNDDPADVAPLRAAVRRSLEKAGPRGCVIWATVSRPPQHGSSYDAANALLNDMARTEPRLRIVQWAQRIQAQPALMIPDQIHPGPEGYRLRAQLFAEAAMSC